MPLQSPPARTTPGSLTKGRGGAARAHRPAPRRSRNLRQCMVVPATLKIVSLKPTSKACLLTEPRGGGRLPWIG
ncbi:hypothetical protein CRUP_027168 [Coryphaenoides rupestris]|nr:hypothetical protein CRUP_027168 [Coryphaenoides rupestris]